MTPEDLRESLRCHYAEYVTSLKDDVAGGLSIGTPEIQKATDELQPGEVLSVAALSGHGKTALGLKIGMEVAFRGKGVLYRTWEMPKVELFRRMAGMVAGVPPERRGLPEERFNPLAGRKEWTDTETELLKEGAAFVEQRLGNLWIMDDPTDRSPEGVLEKVGVLKPELVVIDYFQEMYQESPEFYKDMNHALSSLTKAAKPGRMGFSLLLLHQFNSEAERGLKDRNGDFHRPHFRSVEGGTKILQFSTLAMVLFQEWRYLQRKPAPRGVSRIYVEKSRSGGLPEPIGITFDGPSMLYGSLSFKDELIRQVA